MDEAKEPNEFALRLMAGVLGDSSSASEAEDTSQNSVSASPKYSLVNELRLSPFGRLRLAVVAEVEVVFVGPVVGLDGPDSRKRPSRSQSPVVVTALSGVEH